jgi:hypothetical protein
LYFPPFHHCLHAEIVIILNFVFILLLFFFETVTFPLDIKPCSPAILFVTFPFASPL